MSGTGDPNANMPAAASYDAVVIGAGPAGSTAARELARRGIQVLLLERKTLPRSKVCGACLSQRALSWLEWAGLAHLPPQLGAVPTKRFRAYCGGQSVQIELPGGAAVSRESFDAALAQAAIDCGARLLTGTTATLRDIGPDAGFREIELRGHAGNTQTIQAGVVLAADGLGHPALAHCREFKCRVSRGAKLGVRTRIVGAPQSFQPGTIYMAIGRGGYAGLVRLEDDSLNLAAAVVPQAIKRAASPSAAVAAILAEAGMPACDLFDAGAWQGTLPLTQSTRRPVGHRVFVLGDAAGYVEPFTGEGMACALAGGLAVAPFAERGLRDWNRHVEQGWLRAYRRLVGDRQLWCRGFAAILRHPSMALDRRPASVVVACVVPADRGQPEPVRPAFGAMSLMSLYLEAIGTAVPRHSIDQADAVGAARSFCAASCVQPRVLDKLYQRSGVRTRHSVVLQGSANGSPANQSFYLPAIDGDDLGPTTAERMRVYEESAWHLGVAACADALAAAKAPPAEVTHLITVSCTGFHSPGVDVALVRELGLEAGVARTHIGFMGCHAALNALRVARAFTQSRSECCVLICAVELCSLHYQYGWEPDRLVSNALFADGAAAVVARSALAASGPHGWQLIASNSAIVPETENAMRWHIRDHGFEMTLSAKVPDLIREKLRPWLAAWLAQTNLSIEDVRSWAIHPGGPRILAACGQACGLTEADLRPSVEVLSDYGNMSSPTILFILHRLRCQAAAGPCVALAFGPGLTIEAALFI